MRRTLTAVVVAGALLAMVPAGALAKGPSTELRHGAMQGIVHAKGARPNRQPKNPNLTYHQGDVMTSGAAVTPIYWGPSWKNADYSGSKRPGLDQFYVAVSDSLYLRTNTEYVDANGSHVSSTVYPSPGLLDSSKTPKRAPSVSAVLAVVAANISPDPSGNGYYPVYSDQKRGGAQYCAWHSWGTINGTPVQFAFFFDLTGDPGCDPGWDTSGLAALVNVSGHELSEALTDPRGKGWTDSSGSENADKCAWVFDEPAKLSDGSYWHIQGNWSNAAYDTSSGYANLSGQLGCIYNK